MRINLNAGGPQTAIITDFATKTVDILIIEPKMYMEHKVGAAARMGIKRTTLISRMKKLGIDRARYREPASCTPA